MDETGSRNTACATGPLLAGSAALVAVWLAMLLLGAGAADRELLLALYAADEPWLSLGAIGLTNLGGARFLIPVAVLGGLWLLYRRRPGDALTLLGAVLLGKLLVLVQKAWLARLRPEENMRLVEVSDLSFPSGHAANSMVLYLMLALLLFDDPRKRRIAAACAIALSGLIGLSRPLLGVHWPSDVVGGWAFGLLWVMLCLRVAQTLKRNRRTSPS
jgi:undecaprenyl-diphosphatase